MLKSSFLQKPLRQIASDTRFIRKAFNCAISTINPVFQNEDVFIAWRVPGIALKIDSLSA